MDSSLGTGLMAVFAVSGSVVFLAAQVHKRFLSNFMKKMESEMKNSTGDVEPRKKVRFADDVTVYSVGDEKACGEEYTSSTAAAGGGRNPGKTSEAMPENWQVMCQGSLQRRNLEGPY